MNAFVKQDRIDQTHIHFAPPSWSWKHVPHTVRRWVIAGIAAGVTLQTMVLYRQGLAALAGAFTSIDALLTVAASIVPGIIYFGAIRGISVGFSARVPYRVDRAVDAIGTACEKRSLRPGVPMPAGIRGRGRKLQVDGQRFVLLVVPSRNGSVISARRFSAKDERIVQELLNEIDWALQKGQSQPPERASYSGN